MIDKEFQAKAGSITEYTGYIIILFVWYFLNNVAATMQTALAKYPLMSLIDWMVRILVVPFLFAGLYGAIYEQRRSQNEWSIRNFVNAAKKYYWRITGANLLSIVFFLFVLIAVALIGGGKPIDMENNKLLIAFISVPSAAINLFWFAGIVVKGRIFAGLFHSARTLLFTPAALAIGILWGLISYADSTGIEFPGGQMAFMFDGVRAVILAIVRVFAVMYVFVIFRLVQGETTDQPVEEATLLESTSPGDGLVKASFGFTFVSFLPLFHFVALILGILALRRKKRFVFRSALACSVGGFFTIFYFLLVAGWVTKDPSTPSYSFLSDVNSGLKSQVMLLEKGAFREAQQQLEQGKTGTSGHDWAFETALALAKYQAGDLDGALKDFSTAAQKNPQKGEFYYYYGVVLLEDGQEQTAARQFQAALEHEPALEGAQRYLDLINNIYKPSKLVSILSSVFILLALFTIHEFGHAFAAWKLGDDTAQKQGRLTLNPLSHLELFGSILLPAMLLWQQSGIVFGWAKPVPVNPENFKDPQKDHMRVSFAGPAMNLIVAMITFILLGCMMLIVRLLWPETISMNFAAPFASVSLVGPPFARSLVTVIVFLKELFYMSLILGCLNLLPVPPFDGSWILSGLLPQGPRIVFEKVRQYGFIIFLLLAVTSAMSYILSIPIGLAWGVFQVLVSAMGLG